MNAQRASLVLFKSNDICPSSVKEETGLILELIPNIMYSNFFIEMQLVFLSVSSEV
jgi:hypothetical protein